MPFPVAELPHVAYRIGKYYGPPTMGAPQTVTPGNNVLDCSYIRIERAISIDRIAAYVNTLSAGSNLRFGIWKGDGEAYTPKTLLADLGTIGSDTAGVKELTISPALWLPRGIHWLGCATQNGTPNIRAFTCATPFVGGDNTNWLIGGTGFPSAWTVTGFSGACRDLIASELQGLALPMAIVVRTASV